MSPAATLGNGSRCLELLGHGGRVSVWRAEGDRLEPVSLLELDGASNRQHHARRKRGEQHDTLEKP